MKLLLDSHAFLWFIWDDPNLSQTAKTLIEDPGNQKLVSVASCWEIAIKVGLTDRGVRAMTVKTKPLAEVSHQAIEVLARELGAADAIRFINQFTTGYGDYTSERDTLFADQTLDQIIAVIKKTRPDHGAISNNAEGAREEIEGVVFAMG